MWSNYGILIGQIAGILLVVPATFGILRLCRKWLPEKDSQSSEPFWFGQMMNLFSVMCCVELVFGIYFFWIGNEHAEQFAKFIFAPTITLLGLKVIAGIIKGENDSKKSKTIEIPNKISIDINKYASNK